METTLIKPIVRVGNSAGVLLPKAWMNSKARVELIQESIESLKKRKKEHEEKLKIYEGKNYALKEYWEKEIERFNDKIDEFESKLNE